MNLGWKPKISDTYAPPHGNNYRVNLNQAQGFVMRYIWCHHLPSRGADLYEEERYIQATNTGKMGSWRLLEILTGIWYYKAE